MLCAFHVCNFNTNTCGSDAGVNCKRDRDCIVDSIWDNNFSKEQLEATAILPSVLHHCFEDNNI